MQYLQFTAARADTGAVLPLAVVTVYLTGTTTNASLFDNTGAGIGNPVTADANGLVSFAAADAKYDIQVTSSDRLYSAPKMIGVQIVDLVALGEAVVPVSSRSILAAIPSPAANRAAYLEEVGRQGQFVFSTSAHATDVALDPLQGIYVAPASDTTGGSGAWIRQFSGAVYARWFGAKGDGAADDTAAIQAFANLVCYHAASALGRIDAGQYKTSDTIQFGYGVTYNGTPYVSCTIEGASSGAGGFSSDGTTMLPTFRDRPVFAFQGCMNPLVRGISFFGDEAYMVSQGLTYPAGQIGSPTTGNAAADTIATWVNPSWPANASSRYAPFCAIAFDPYTGAAPTPAYPAVTYPSFLGTVSQYNKTQGSKSCVEDCEIGGFMAAIVYQPSGSSLQTDFGKVQRCWIEFCVYAISVSHNDARVMSCAESYISSCHTAFIGSAHGQQLGQFGAAIVNCGIDRCVNWIDLADPAADRGGCVSFTNCYGENAWRIGRFGPSSGASRQNNSLVLDNCHLVFAYENLLGRPSNQIEISNGAWLHIRAGSYQNIEAPFVIKGEAATTRIDGAGFWLRTQTGLPTYEQFARSVAPVLFTNMAQPPETFSATWDAYLTSDGSIYRQEAGQRCISDFTKPGCVWSREFVPSAKAFSASSSIRSIRNPCLVTSMLKSQLSAISISDLEMTLTFNSRDAIDFSLHGPSPGDIIVDSTSGSVFFTHARTGQVVSAKLMNNYRGSAGAFTNASPFAASLNSDVIYFVNSRLFTPRHYTKGDIASSSATISNAANDAESAANITTDIPVGCSIFTDPSEDSIVSYTGTNAVVSATSVGSKTITLTGNAIKTEARRQLALFVLAPPANV